MDQEDEAEKARQKRALCRELYGLDGRNEDDDNDNDNDPDDLALLLKRSRTKAAQSRATLRSFNTMTSSSLSAQDKPPGLLRRHTHAEGTEVEKSSVGANVAQIKRTSADISKGAEPSTAVAKRRRKDSTVHIRPEAQRIFKGMVFFFIPNDDIAPARRMRINKAIEFGASRAPDWQSQITHIVVDKCLTFQDVLKYLKLESLPPTVLLVNETYPGECMRSGSVIDPSHTRFRVNGSPSPSAKEPSPQVEAQQPESLKLKPPRNQQMETPSTEENEPNAETSYPPLVVAGRDLEATDDPPRALERESDLLDDMIEQAKAEKDLPLDSSDNEDEGVGSSYSNSDSENEQRKARSPKSKKPQNNPSWQNAFSCMHKHDGNTKDTNPNGRTIEVLQQMLDYYTRTSDQWRTLAYRKAISALRRQKEKVVTNAQASAITGIGERLAAKIEEIVWTNRLRRLEQANMEPHDILLSNFLCIYGVGFSQASKWIAQGYQSLEDLAAKASLSKNQRIGIEHYYDFLQRIPREEVAAHGDVVKKLISKYDKAIEVIISGSYRRGAASSGDIDLIITKDGASGDEIRSVVMDRVVPELFDQGFLKVGLAVSSSGDGSKWHGASALPDNPIWRRIDLLFVPGDEIGAALIYFTGNDIFNRSLRLLASKKGMCLNQRGLFADILRQQNRVKLNSGRLLESRDEKRIFELLGVPWRPPCHRIC